MSYLTRLARKVTGVPITTPDLPDGKKRAVKNDLDFALAEVAVPFGTLLGDIGIQPLESKSAPQEALKVSGKEAAADKVSKVGGEVASPAVFVVHVKDQRDARDVKLIDVVPKCNACHGCWVLKVLLLVCPFFYCMFPSPREQSRPKMNDSETLLYGTPDHQRMSMMNSITSVSSRICVCLVGIILGAILLMPNLMLSDSGTPRAIRAAIFGMLASYNFVVGGLSGAILGYPWHGWFWLLPAVAFQFVAIFDWAALPVIGIICYSIWKDLKDIYNENIIIIVIIVLWVALPVLCIMVFCIMAWKERQQMHRCRPLTAVAIERIR